MDQRYPEDHGASSSATPVLAGIRVLDFGRYIAAPWCSAILADMGADVIRVERREGGEDRWVQSVIARGEPARAAERGGGEPADGEGAGFLQCNRNKRGLTLDPTTEQGAEVTRRLVASADVVIANMPPKAMQAMGLDYDSLRAIKPDIILANATAYGEGGPYSDRIGFDGTGQVMSGAVHRQGLPDLPIRTIVPYVDYGTAMALALGVMMALYHRQSTGEGQQVQGALLSTALMIANAALIERDLLGVEHPRTANRGTSVAPCDLFEASDGWVLMQISGRPMFKRWCRLMGRDELIDDPRFANDGLRFQHIELLNGIMQAWCRSRTSAEVTALLEEAKLPGAPVASPDDVLHDPHVAAMGFLQRVPFPGADRPVPIIETPFRLSQTPGVIARRAPLLGEHTDEVLAEVGYDAEQIADLRAQHVV